MVDYWRHGQIIAMGMEIGDGDWGRLYSLYILLCLRLWYESTATALGASD